MFNKKEDEEKFLVSGKGCVVFNLEFKPDSYAVEFVHEHTQSVVYPSCNPVKVDSVHIELMEFEFDYGVKICWEVNEMREVKWIALKLM